MQTKIINFLKNYQFYQLHSSTLLIKVCLYLCEGIIGWIVGFNSSINVAVLTTIFWFKIDWGSTCIFGHLPYTLCN